LFGQLKDIPEFFFKKKIFAGTPVNSYHRITCNFDELANEMEGLAISYYFVIGDPKKMTIWTTCHKMG